MQNAIVWFRAGLGMQALLAGLAIVLALIYRRKDNRGRMLLLARLLSWGMAAVMIVNVVMIAGLLLTMRQFGLSHSRLFVVNLVVIGLMGVLEMALLKMLSGESAVGRLLRYETDRTVDSGGGDPVLSDHRN